MDTNFLNDLQQMHLALWNESDPTRRRDLISRIYADNVRMYDKDFVLTGTEEVVNFIGKLLSEDPGFTFTITRPVQATQNGLRLFWKIETGGATLTGMDFFVMENERVRDLYVFMDENNS